MTATRNTKCSMIVRSIDYVLHFLKVKKTGAISIFI
jgi:hypothetical protein